MNRDTFNAIGLLVLRVSAGLFMLVGHGWGKLTGFGEMKDSFPDPLGMGSQLSLISAIGAEVGASLLLVLGLATRLAALPLVFTMAVALFVVHADDPWGTKEMAALYGVVYVALALTGGGKFSLDEMIKRKRGKGKKADS